ALAARAAERRFHRSAHRSAEVYDARIRAGKARTAVVRRLVPAGAVLPSIHLWEGIMANRKSFKAAAVGIFFVVAAAFLAGGTLAQQAPGKVSWKMQS